MLKKRKRYSRKPDGEVLASGLGSRHALIIAQKNTPLLITNKGAFFVK
ncbi:hypothetical protein AB406_1270 [Riemerella anatipestifer]|uniref:Uncharacterized protein n=1 Tax=Riemerella anatipestifer TaxID=34085 RepID=A0A1S7DT29_RIEAN|nr:hypothetical protein AB406_1270 [Riemerella anatipestifer]